MILLHSVSIYDAFAEEILHVHLPWQCVGSVLDGSGIDHLESALVGAGIGMHARLRLDDRQVCSGITFTILDVVGGQLQCITELLLHILVVLLLCLQESCLLDIVGQHALQMLILLLDIVVAVALVDLVGGELVAGLFCPVLVEFELVSERILLRMHQD